MDEHASDFAGREEHQGKKMANRELNLTVAYAPPSEPLAAMRPSPRDSYHDFTWTYNALAGNMESVTHAKSCQPSFLERRFSFL